MEFKQLQDMALFALVAEMRQLYRRRTARGIAEIQR